MVVISSPELLRKKPCPSHQPSMTMANIIVANILVSQPYLPQRLVQKLLKKFKLKVSH